MDIVIGMQAAGYYWPSAYEHADEQDYDVRVIKTIWSNIFHEAYMKQVKNDSKDTKRDRRYSPL